MMSTANTDHTPAKCETESCKASAAPRRTFCLRCIEANDKNIETRLQVLRYRKSQLEASIAQIVAEAEALTAKARRIHQPPVRHIPPGVSGRDAAKPTKSGVRDAISRATRVVAKDPGPLPEDEKAILRSLGISIPGLRL